MSIRTEQRGGSYWITIDNQPKRNAITKKMYDELCAGLDEANRNGEVVLTVFTGVGDFFSSGNYFNPNQANALFQTMVKIKIRMEAAYEKKGDLIVCEVSEHFLPHSGSAEGIWRRVGDTRLSELRTDNPMKDYEIRQTSAFKLGKRYPGGVLHLKLPLFPPSNQNESNNRLSQCYISILQQAVELKAKRIIFPFIGCFSVDFPIEHGVDVALRTIVQFINNSNTGLLDEIYLCTTGKDVYKMARMHDSYVQEKRAQRSIANSKRASLITEWILNILLPDYHAPRMDSTKQLEKLNEVTCNDRTFECKQLMIYVDTHEIEELKDSDEGYSSTMHKLIQHKKVLISLVNGPAIGFPCTFLGLFDYVVCSESAYFHTPFMSLGMPPEGASTALFQKIMGISNANGMLLFNEPMSARQALQRNFVSRVFGKDEFTEKTAALVDKYSSLPKHSLLATRALIRNQSWRREMLSIHNEERELVKEIHADPRTKELIQKRFGKSNI